jgi:nucleoside diphosphate kinase
MPTNHKGLVLKPLFGEPEEVAQVLRAYQRQGITHVQLNMDQMTTKMIEDFAPVLALLDGDG